MRKRIFIALLGNLFGAVALALVLAWAVGAQGPEPSWEQVNIDGFGNPSNGSVLSLAVFSDTLYAGTGNGDTGGEVWHMGSPWTAVITGGLGGHAYNGALTTSSSSKATSTPAPGPAKPMAARCGATMG